MKRIRLAGIILIDDKIALIHREKVKNREYSNYYVFPGGGLEPNETYEQGTIREVKEELGIDVEVEKLLFTLEKVNMTEYFYLCKYIGGEYGTGEGPEFTNNPKYADSGEYIPELINKQDFKNLFVLPPEAKEFLVKEIENNNI